MADAFWELSGWDGRFASTVRTLFRHPGKLTRDFLEGRRARYISPLRLYLMASLVYFVVSAAVPRTVPRGGTVYVGGVKIGAAGPSSHAAQRVAADAQQSVMSEQPLTGAARDSALRDVAKAPPIFQPFLRRVVVDPAGFRRGLLDAMPRVLFALVPVFAAIVGLFYRKRRYPRASLFRDPPACVRVLGARAARHHEDPAFLDGHDDRGLGAILWMPTYTTIAFRRTYGGSMTRTLAKEVCIGTLYVVASGIVLMGAVYWVAMFE